MQPPTLIPSNTFSCLAIHGLVKDNKGSNVPLTLHRSISELVKPTFLTREDTIRPEGPPTRLPRHRAITLLAFLCRIDWAGSGRVGSVYSVDLNDTANFSLDLSAPDRLPSLVVKVAGPRRRQDLAREAWFYEEIEHLQGVSIARCYGVFEADIDEGCEVLDWAERDEEEEEDEIEEENPSDEEGTAPTCILTPRASSQTAGKSVAVLILEGFGDPIPLEVSLESIEPDVYEVYEDISRFGIEHMDVRWSNILKAPEAPDNLVCPHHGHQHEWRIVDFDRSRKTNMVLDHLHWCHSSWLRGIFRCLPKGYIIEPWE